MSTRRMASIKTAAQLRDHADALGVALPIDDAVMKLSGAPVQVPGEHKRVPATMAMLPPGPPMALARIALLSKTRKSTGCC